MKNYLFPVYFKKIGWIMFALFFLVLLVSQIWDIFEVRGRVLAMVSGPIFGPRQYFTFVNASLTFNIGLMGLLVSLLFIAFSRQKIEDEYVTKIREGSLVWAVMVNYGLLLLAIFFIFELDFLNYLFINMYTVLVLFILKFNIEIYRSRKTMER